MPTQPATGALRLDLTTLKARVSVLSKAAVTAGKSWRPCLTGAGTPRWGEICVALGARGIAGASLNDIPRNHAGLLLQPPTPQQASRVAPWAVQTESLVTIDHYAQALTLSAAARACGGVVLAAIAVDTGQSSCGMRPGLDVVDLAYGIAHLPGIQLAGLVSHDGYLLDIADPMVREQRRAAGHEILRSTRRLLTRQNLRCDFVGMGCSAVLTENLASDVIDEIHAGRAIWGQDHDPSLTVLATVVSRPTRVRAVVDQGYGTMGYACYPRVLHWNDARVCAMSSASCSLELSGESQSLRIGDMVTLAPQSARAALAVHRSVDVYEGDRYCDQWPLWQSPSP